MELIKSDLDLLQASTFIVRISSDFDSSLTKDAPYRLDNQTFVNSRYRDLRWCAREPSHQQQQVVSPMQCLVPPPVELRW